jgi:hypothetical protein
MDGDTGDTESTVETWHTKLPEDLRADPSLVDFKDETEMVPMPINVARSYINTKKLVGRDKIPMPSTPEEWNDTYNRLGRPEAPTQYNVAVEGVDDTNPQLKEILSKDVEWFKNVAHEAGLSDTQARKLFKRYTDKTVETFTGMQTNHEVNMNAAETELRTAYGNNFEGKMVLMNRGIEELDRKVGGGLKDIVKNTGLVADPKFVKAMVLVGEMMSEDLGLDKSTGGPAIDAASLDEQIKTLQSSPAYLSSADPAHNVTVQKVAKLMQMKHGKRPVDPMTRSSFLT